MPYSLDLEHVLAQAGWKVKIHDAEGPEEPHVTIYKKLRRWRLSLRTAEFLDQGDKWSQIHKKVRAAIENEWHTIQDEWDRLHPHNPISSEDDDQDNQE